MVALATDPDSRRLQVRDDVCWNDNRGVDAEVTGDCSSESETLYSVIADI
jgi:hypothetical protein